MNTYRLVADEVTQHPFNDIGSTLTQDRRELNTEVTGWFDGKISVKVLFEEILTIETDKVYILIIENDIKQSFTLNITFDPPGTLTSISPSSYTLDQGQSFTVVGENLPTTSPQIYFSTSSTKLENEVQLLKTFNNNTTIFGEYISGGVVGTTYYFVADYDGVIVGLGNTAITFVQDPIPVVCFKKGSKILCLKNEKEVEILIEDIKIGTLVKTLYKGYLSVNIIGKNTVYNSGDNIRMKDRLYKLSKNKYTELNEDLYLTGCHSILVDNLADNHYNKIIKDYGKIFCTEDKYRLPVYIDERSEPFKEKGIFDIYHLALNGDNVDKNHGIYANGLIVETCFERRIRNEMKACEN
jgi:hypothetical protein